MLVCILYFFIDVLPLSQASALSLSLSVSVSVSVHYVSLSHIAQCLSFNTVCEVTRYRGFDSSLTMNKIHLSVSLSLSIYIYIYRMQELFLLHKKTIELSILQSLDVIT